MNYKTFFKAGQILPLGGGLVARAVEGKEERPSAAGLLVLGESRLTIGGGGKRGDIGEIRSKARN